MNEFLGLSGKVAVVTGAASGIGEAVARGLAREGARLVLADLNQAGLDRLVGDLGPEVRSVVVDVSQAAEVARLFETADEVGPVDILVTCAGIINGLKLLEMTEQAWDRTFAVNTKGTFFCIQEAAKRMLPRRSGRMVLIGSDSAKRGGGRIATHAYSASKGAVVTLMKNVAREIVGSGVAINLVNPGPVDSPMHAPLTDEQRRMVASSIPLGRMARPDEIANAVLFLASERAASFVFGESFNVDGGTTMD